MIDTPANQFSKWMDSLPKYEQVFFLNKISLKCDLTYQTVYQWRMGKGNIRTPYIDIINEVAGEKIIVI